jgi:hypothetical protein
VVANSPKINVFAKKRNNMKKIKDKLKKYE